MIVPQDSAARSADRAGRDVAGVTVASGVRLFGEQAGETGRDVHRFGLIGVSDQHDVRQVAQLTSEAGDHAYHPHRSSAACARIRRSSDGFAAGKITHRHDVTSTGLALGRARSSIDEFRGRDAARSASSWSMRAASSAAAISQAFQVREDRADRDDVSRTHLPVDR